MMIICNGGNCTIKFSFLKPIDKFRFQRNNYPEEEYSNTQQIFVIDEYKQPVLSNHVKNTYNYSLQSIIKH